jgi:Glycine/sarcosine/betaine reductase selenoprotein B (GRDB)
MENSMSGSASSEPVTYMERTRLYYRALGYDNDYVWAHFDQVPFTRLAKPLPDAKVALVTTALPPDLAEARAAGKRQLWSRETASPPSELFTDHVAWDKESTHTRDRECYLPIGTVTELANEGLVGGLTRRFHGVPTTYSQRRTLEQDAPEITRRIKEDGADAVLLCPL